MRNGFGFLYFGVTSEGHLLRAKIIQNELRTSLLLQLVSVHVEVPNRQSVHFVCTSPIGEVHTVNGPFGRVFGCAIRY